MADNVRTLLTINNFNNEENSKLIRNSTLIQAITSRSTPIVDIVNGLEQILTHDDKDVRRRGVEFISWILSQFPSEFLNATEIKFFAGFLSSRLVDHHSFIPETLKSLLSLMNMQNTSDETATEIVHNIFQLVTCQAQVTKDRHTIYLILRSLQNLHPECVGKLEPKFMCNIIASIEGETDPQNLLLLFAFLPKFFGKLVDDTATEDLFEVFSTYFPVDFTTVKKDNVVITREDLAEGLGQCLTATPKLADKCLPMILEKLDSTFKAAKIDSYKLLQRCCDRLDGSHLEAHLNDLWKMMQRDLLPALDPEIQRQGLLAISALTSALNGNPQIMEKFLDDVIIAIRSLVSKPRDSLFSPAIRILDALCPHSESAARRAFLELQVLCRPNVHSEADLLILLPATQSFIAYMKQDEPALQAIGALALKTAVGVVALRRTSLQVLQKVAVGLSSQEGWRTELLAALVLVFKTSQCNDTIKECCKLFRQLTKSHATEMKTVYEHLEKLLSTSEVPLDVFLDATAAIVDLSSATSFALPRYIAFGKEKESCEKALQSLLRATQNTTSSHFLTTLYSSVLELVMFWKDTGTRGTIQLLSFLLKEVLVCRDPKEQCQLVESVEFQNLLSEACNCQNKESSLPLITEGLLGALWPEVPVTNLSQVVDALLNQTLTSDNEDVRESSARGLAAVVNKSSTLDILEKVVSLLERIDIDSDRVVRLFCWTLKGALIGGIANLEPYLNQWFSLLDNLSTSHYAAVDTQLLLKYLYRQRLFSRFPHLTDKLRTTSDESLRRNYLLAGITLCSAVPQQVLLYELNNVAMVVSQAMQTNQPEVVEPAMSLLLTLLQEKSSLLIDHTNSLLKTLLELARPPATLRVRRTALQCLFHAGFYPTTFILPFRNQVIKGLAPCLDDHKRLVRNEAAKARQKWFLVGAAGEDELFS